MRTKRWLGMLMVFFMCSNMWVSAAVKRTEGNYLFTYYEPKELNGTFRTKADGGLLLWNLSSGDTIDTLTSAEGDLPAKTTYVGTTNISSGSFIYMTLKPGTKYHVYGWYKGSGGNVQVEGVQPYSKLLSANVTEADGTWNFFSNSFTTASDNSWYILKLRDTSGEGASYYANVGVAEHVTSLKTFNKESDSPVTALNGKGVYGDTAYMALGDATSWKRLQEGWPSYTQGEAYRVTYFTRMMDATNTRSILIRLNNSGNGISSISKIGNGHWAENEITWISGVESASWRTSFMLKGNAVTEPLYFSGLSIIRDYSEIRFTDAEGYVLADGTIAPGTAMHARYHYVPENIASATAEDHVTFITGVYKTVHGQKILQSVQASTQPIKTTDENGNAIINDYTTTVTAPASYDAGATYTVESFVWDSLDHIDAKTTVDIFTLNNM